MKKENGSEQEQLEAYYSHIARLSADAFGTSPKVARRAERSLIKELTESNYFDPIFIAFENGLGVIKEDTNPTSVRINLNRLANILAATASDTEEKNGKNARINSISARSTSSLAAMHEEISLDPRYAYVKKQISELPLVGGAYQTIMGTALKVNEMADKGSNNVFIHFTDPAEDPALSIKRNKEYALHSEWFSRFKEPQFALDTGIFKPILKDQMVTILKEEPAVESDNRLPFSVRKFAGKTFSELEDMGLLLSKEDTLSWMEYVTEVFSDKDRSEWWVTNKQLMSSIFFQNMVTDESDPTPANNPKFLSQVSDFQEKLAWLILFEEDIDSVNRIKAFLDAAPQSTWSHILNTMAICCVDPGKRDITIEGEEKIPPRHIFAEMASAYIIEKRQHQSAKEFLYSDEIGYDFLQHFLYPALKNRANELNLSLDHITAIDEAQQRLEEEITFEKAHLQSIKDIFTQNCGEEFIKKLNGKHADLDAIRQNAWDLFEADGMHYLPMMDGFNTITFSDNSVPEIMGLESVSFNISGELNDWITNVFFKMRNTEMVLMGILDDNGKLQFKAPVESEIPGLYYMLNHIVVLTFKDLTTQVRKDSEDFDKKGDKDAPKSERDNSNNESTRERFRFLPRTQSDREVIEAVSTDSHLTPRPVELHTAWVRGGKEYQSAVQLYNEAVENNESEDSLKWIRQELEKARENSYRASEEKISSLPKRFENNRVHIVDPIIDEERDLVTWVVFHVSPKPTQDEVQHPVKLYERYYSKSSSIASLEQLKPWFIGQD